MTRVVIAVQENHTTDCYFGALAPYGANVATGWPAATNPPPADPRHDRPAYYRWLTGRSPGAHVQFDAAALLPFYAWLALTGTFFENHCAGFGTNSTANHLLILGGQSPTLRNPPSSSPEPVWDLPSLPGLAEDNGVSWRAYVGSGRYPVRFYAQLTGSASIVDTAQFEVDAAAGNLPALSFLYHDAPLDEHPRADVTLGMAAVWRAVDAVVRGGGWQDTVFLLTWDDWGGYDDHVATPAVEYTPDNVQLAYGPRVPLLMFGGTVTPGIDSRWCSHVSLPKTAIQLLGLPDLGVPRLDADAGLADRVAPNRSGAPPPPYGTSIVLPPPPDPAPVPNPLPPPPVARPVPVPPVVLRGGKTLPPPADVLLPPQPAPPAAEGTRWPSARGRVARPERILPAPDR